MNFTNVCSIRGPSSADRTPVVFLVDSDEEARESSGDLIRSAGWRMQMAATAEEFLASPYAPVPACLVVELRLPDMSGLDLQRLVSDRTEMPVIFMSSHIDVRATVQAMKAGALEFLTKPCAGEGLLQAIRHGIERSHAALRQLFQIRALHERYESLSRRERDVMDLVVTGRLNEQVGSDPGISEITVKAHRGKVMRKMQAGSFAELVNIAARLSPGPRAAHQRTVNEHPSTRGVFP